MGGMEGGGKGKRRGATVWSHLPFCYVLKSTMNGGLTEYICVYGLFYFKIESNTFHASYIDIYVLSMILRDIIRNITNSLRA